MSASRGAFLASAFVGGLVTALAFPPFAAPALAPVGLAALTISAGGGRGRRGLAAGFAFGLAFFGVTLWWLAGSISPVAWVALTLIQAGWLAVAGAGISLMRGLRAWPMWAACWWTAIESARSAIPWGGVPWGRLGLTALDTPWQGLLGTLGVAATGTAVALLGTTLAAVTLAVERRRAVLQTPLARLGATVSVGVLVTATVAGTTPTISGGPVAHVGIVQGGVPGDGTQVARNHRAVTAQHLAETRALAQRADGGPPPELVIWPENALAVDPDRDSVARRALTVATEAVGVPLLVGAVTDDANPSRARNQGIVWTSAGAGSRYTKQHLVPFGEFVPFRSLAERISSRVADIERDMVAGAPDPSPLRVGSLRVADALCFDVAYDDTIRDQVSQGADLVVVQTSNAMFLGTAQPEQQWAMTRARAIEVGRSIVVSSINGISGAIAPDGSVLKRLPTTRAASTVAAVPLITTTTLATRFGPWPARLVWIAAAVALLLAIRRRPDHEHSSGEY